MHPGNVKIDKDYVEMFPYMVDGHEYWNAWDIDGDGKPDIMRERTGEKTGEAKFVCFPTQAVPAEDASKYEGVLKKFKGIAEICDEGIDAGMTRSQGHLEKINDVFLKARQRALENFDLFQGAVLSGNLIRGMFTIESDRTNWNPVKFLGEGGSEIEITIDEVGNEEAPRIQDHETCYPDSTDITSIHLDVRAGKDVYIRDMDLLDGGVREWLEDYYRMSWASLAWMFSSECPPMSYEWFSPFEYCKTHSDEICELEF